MKAHSRSRWFLFVLLLACVASGVWLSRVHRSAQTAEHTLNQLTLETRQRAQEIDTLRQTLAEGSSHASPSTSVVSVEQLQQNRRALTAEIKRTRPSDLTKPSPSPRLSRDPSGPSGDHFPELMSDPEYARLAAQLSRNETRTRWLQAFRFANIPPEKQTQLRALLLEFGTSGEDAIVTARRAGATEEQAWKARMQAAQEVSDEITALIGAEAYEKIQRTQQAQGAEELVERLESRLSYSGTPLQPTQATQLFQLGVDLNLDRIVTDSTTFPALIEKARPFLNQDQLQALRDVASEFNGGKGGSGVTSSSPTP
jgi:hypothetical protein